jgi:hypothetical protein
MAKPCYAYGDFEKVTWEYTGSISPVRLSLHLR